MGHEIKTGKMLVTSYTCQSLQPPRRPWDFTYVFVATKTKTEFHVEMAKHGSTIFTGRYPYDSTQLMIVISSRQLSI